MRLGGANSSCKRGSISRCVVALLAAVLVVAAVGAGTAGADEHSAAVATEGLWAVTRDSNGGMHVVRGLGAAVATIG